MRGETDLHIWANTDPSLIPFNNESRDEKLDELLLSIPILTEEPSPTRR